MTETAAEPSTVTAAGGSAAVRTVFFGRGSFAVPVLDALVGIRGVRVEAVVSAPDRPVGRRAIVTPTPGAEPSTVTAADGSAAVRTVFFGSGSFAVPVLDALVGIRG